MANLANFTVRMTGPNTKLKELLNLLSAAPKENGWLTPSKILPVDPDAQPRWIRFDGPEEWEADTTAVISGYGKYTPPKAMVCELSLKYPDVVFQVDYCSEGGEEGLFEFSNGMFNEIEYLQKFDAGEYAYYVRDGKRLDPPETNVEDKERYAGDIVPIV